MSQEGEHPEQHVRLTGRGFTSGTTLSFWRDANFDGVQDPDEAQLCQANINAKGIGECTFEASNPSFVPGFGDCFIESDHESSAQHDHFVEERNCNFINGVDGQGHSSILVIDEEMQAANSIDSSPQILEPEGRVEVSELNCPDPRAFVTLTNLPLARLFPLM